MSIISLSFMLWHIHIFRMLTYDCMVFRDIGSKLNPLVESAVRRSLGFFRKSHAIDSESGKTNQCPELDVNCSVVLDTDSFTVNPNSLHLDC